MCFLVLQATSPQERKGRGEKKTTKEHLASASEYKKLGLDFSRQSDPTPIPAHEISFKADKKE